MKESYIKKEISCRTVSLIIAYIKTHMVRAYPAVIRLFESCGFNESFFLKEERWVSFSFINLLYNLVYEHCGNPYVLYEIALKTDELTPVTLPVIIFKTFRSPGFAFRQTVRFAGMYERISRLHLLDMGKNYAVVEEEFSSYRQTWHSYQYARGIFARIPQVCGMDLQSAEMIECSFPLTATPFFKKTFTMRGDYIYDLQGNQIAHKDAPVKYLGTLYNAKSDVHKIIWKSPERHISFKSRNKEQYESMITRLEEDSKQIEEKERLETEIDLARRLQLVYLPTEPPDVKGWDIAFVNYPLVGVSGDFYDFFVTDRKLIGVGLFDVSGHGIASAIITMLGKSIVYRRFTAGQGVPLGLIMDSINTELIEELSLLGYYLTGTLLRVTENRVEYVNAAHPPILHFSVDSGLWSEEEFHSGFLLGVQQTDVRFESAELTAAPGDLLLLITDGLIESRDRNDIPYPTERIEAVAASCAEKPAQKIADAVMNDFFEYIGQKDKLQDDVTLVVMKKR